MGCFKNQLGGKGRGGVVDAMGYFKTNTSEGKERVEGWKVGVGGGVYCSEISTREKP